MCCVSDSQYKCCVSVLEEYIASPDSFASQSSSITMVKGGVQHNYQLSIETGEWFVNDGENTLNGSLKSN